MENNYNLKLDFIKGQLAEFGLVEQCEIIGKQFHLKITDGFSIKATNTFKLMNLVNELTYYQFPYIEKAESDNNLFHYILKT